MVASQLSLVRWDTVVQCSPLEIIGKVSGWTGKDATRVLVVLIDQYEHDSVGFHHPLEATRLPVVFVDELRHDSVGYTHSLDLSTSNSAVDTEGLEYRRILQ